MRTVIETVTFKRRCNVNIEKIAQAIEADAGVALPDVRQAELANELENA